MKKTYFAPELELSTLNTADIIATSAVNDVIGNKIMLANDSLLDDELWD